MIRDRARVSFLSTSSGRPPERPSARQEGPRAMASPDRQHVKGSPRVAPRLRTLIPSLVASFVIPIAVYFLLRPHVGSDATALAIGGALPVAWTLARLAWRRRVELFGMLSVVGFGVAFLVTVLSGG